ncbi:hypothetical protein FPV67DRAFT_999761 [Lyophyllum atratum]|nr:hypothetical protein FPV67DRAFT_999761 [Lyophyllum atratum]
MPSVGNRECKDQGKGGRAEGKGFGVIFHGTHLITLATERQPYTATRKLTPSMALLTVLNEDAISGILSVCDIPTVLSASRTCKYLYSFAFSKSLWLALITKMQSRITLDFPNGDSLQSLSACSLVELAKRAIRGSQSWTPSSSQVPVVSHRHVLDLPTTQDHVVKLLAGGKHLMHKQPTNLACWSISQGRRIRKYQPSGEWQSFKVLELQKM